jgi:flagellar motor switch protein FliN
MTATAAPDVTETALAAARAAAQALPSGADLTTGDPVDAVAALALGPQAVAVRARFSGARSGEVVVIVGEDVVTALKESPLGELDVVSAVRPALEAAANALGPCTLDAGTQQSVQQAGEAVLAAGGTLVPLLDGGAVRAALGFAVEAPGRSGSTGGAATGGQRSGVEMLRHVELDVTAELGRTRMTVRELLSLAPGAVIELDRAAGSPADLLVNGRLIARGEVVVIDEHYGIRITEIVDGTQGRS